MAKAMKRTRRRSHFRELMSGVQAMREHHEGRLTLRTHQVQPIALPTLNPKLVRETREAFHMSRQVFAFKLGVNPRTLERWEQGRSKPNEQAAALIWLASVAPPAWAGREAGVTFLGKRPARVLARHRLTTRPACSPVGGDPAGRGSGGESSHS